MAKAHGGVGVLANKASARRKEMSEPDIGEIGALADSWGSSFDVFGLDKRDPVVGSTIMVTAKMLTHRIASLVEFGHKQEDLEQSLYVTGEAALVGLNLLEKARTKRPPKLHWFLAVVASLALAAPAATLFQGSSARPAPVAVAPPETIPPPPPERIVVEKVIEVPAAVPPGAYAKSAEGTAWIEIKGTPEEAVELAKRYAAGDRSGIPITIHFEEPTVDTKLDTEPADTSGAHS